MESALHRAQWRADVGKNRKLEVSDGAMGAGNREGVQGAVTQGGVPHEMALSLFLYAHLLYNLFEFGLCFVF